MSRLPAIGMALVIGVAAGCALHAADDTASDDAPIREMERRAVGPAVPYPADTLSSDQEKLFATSKKARRELGWKTVAKALAPVKIAAAKDVDAGPDRHGRRPPRGAGSRWSRGAH